MPFCPKCRDEFQDWATVCPDCGIKLTKKKPTQNKKIISKKKNTQLPKNKAKDLESLPKDLEDFYNSPGTRGF